MKTVQITEDFDGYPDEQERRTFRKGEEVTVPAKFANLIIEKGYAREVSGSARASSTAADNGEETKPAKSTGNKAT